MTPITLRIQKGARIAQTLLLLALAVFLIATADHTVDASIIDHAEHPTSQDRAANKVERLMEAHYCWRAADGADKPYPTHVIARYEIMSTGETLIRYMGQNTTNFYLRNLGNPSLVAFCIDEESQP